MSAEPADKPTSGDSGTLYIGQLPSNVVKNELEDLFKEYGELVRCDLKRDYGFVEFKEREDAAAALEKLNGTSFMESELKIEWARKPGPRDRMSDDCFKCGQTGHWAKNCPENRGRRDYRDRDRYERYDRGYPGDRYRGEYDRGYDRYDRGYDRAPYDRGYDRGYDRYDRGYDRGAYPERGGYDRGAYYDRAPDRYGYERERFEERRGDRYDRDRYRASDRYDPYAKRPERRSTSPR